MLPAAREKSSSSSKRGGHRSTSKSPKRSDSKERRRGSTAVSIKSTKSNKSVKSTKKSTTSGKSVSSLHTRLLSAKRGPGSEDNRQKKVIMLSPDLVNLGLRREDLAFTGLTTLPNDVFTAKDIGELDISGNNLRSIPTDVYKLTELRALNLSQNSIKCSSPKDYSGLPKELSKLKNLEIVAISECNLRYVPCVLFDCVKLKRLDISRNKFQMLPAEIGNLIELEVLNASETSIKSLPPEIAFCEKLGEINLYGNTLDMLPETMRELHYLCNIKLNARSFHSHIDDYMNKLLKNGQIKSEHIPNVLFDIPELRTLDLDGTRINNLPEDNSCKLEDLYLSNNYFTSIPIGLKTLPYLLMVDLSHNSLESLPAELTDYFPNIKILRFNYNNLQTIPNSICRLITLEELELGNNKISQLPQGIGSLTQLRVLRAPNNRIFSLPESICDLLDMETLELTNNRLGELPMKLCNLTKIKTMHTYSHMKPIGLWLHKNPITEPPEVIWKGVMVRPLFNYLKKLQIKRTENLQPVKLILLGEQGSGKTTLLNTLATGQCMDNTDQPVIHKKYLSNEEQSNLMKRLPRDEMIENIEQPNRSRRGNGSSTCVAAIQKWQSENSIQFCSIDVGGAPVYRILHQFLLDPKAVYLLVYDHRKFTGKSESYHQQIGYWLDLLHLHVPGCVVKAIGTQSDNMTSFSDENKNKVMEAIKEHNDNHMANLALELQKINSKLADAKRNADSAKQGAPNVSNMTEFDPAANIMQLEYQKQQLELLMKKPMRAQPNISVVSCAEGLEGISDLMTEIEMIAINKKLLPQYQRYVPEKWKKLRNQLKKKPSYKLTWGMVKDTADKLKIYGETLQEALEYLQTCGEIIWLRHQPKLQDLVFHKPLKLIEALRGIFHHDLTNLMNFDHNKAFSSIGKLNREQFSECKERMIQYGEVSRQLLLALWYYLPNASTEFYQYCDLIKAFELVYTVPQSEIPTSQSFKEPLMIVPWYVRVDAKPDEIEQVWSSNSKEGERQLEIVYTFPQQFPEGVFERLSAKLQELAYQRLDWANTIYMVTRNSDILIKRYMDEKSLEIHLSIQVRGHDIRAALKQLTEVHQTWVSIVTAIPGLIWKVTHYTAKKNTSCHDSETDSTPKPQNVGESEIGA